ncbi:MAG: riboflavin synthase [bacterium]
MFTGIVEEMGVVKTLTRTLVGARLSILASSVLEDLKIGASLAVNGACLTVVEHAGGEFTVDVSPETLSVTTLGELRAGAPVNLERAMRLTERIGGHLVSGHVDGIGAVRERRQEAQGLWLAIEASPEILRYCVSKGSITVDGISMTLNDVTDRSFSLAVIPHTAKVTTLGVKKPGDRVNLETDVIGKYVERLLRERGQLPQSAKPVIDRDYLEKRGLI